MGDGAELSEADGCGGELVERLAFFVLVLIAIAVTWLAVIAVAVVVLHVAQQM